MNKYTGRVKKRFDSYQAGDLSLPLPQVLVISRPNTAASRAFAPHRVGDPRCTGGNPTVNAYHCFIVVKAVYELTYIKAVSGGGAYAPRVHDWRTSMKAREIMTMEVVSVSPDASILEAVRLMVQNRISGLPVVDHQGTLVGVVTEGDFLRRAETGTQRKRARWIEFFMGQGQSVDEYVHTHGRKVADVMTPTPITITEDTRLDDIVNLMEQSSVKRLPVARQGRVVGIVSRANLLHALATIARFSDNGRNNSGEDHVRVEQQSMVAERLQCAGPRRRGRALGRDP
jgi:CBS domain-containing protein